MFAKIKDHLVPLLEVILQGALLREEKLPLAERADLEENSTKGSQALRTSPSPLGCFLPTTSQALDMGSGQEGRETWERSKQTISRKIGGRNL